MPIEMFFLCTFQCIRLKGSLEYQCFICVWVRGEILLPPSDNINISRKWTSERQHEDSVTKSLY